MGKAVEARGRGEGYFRVWNGIMSKSSSTTK